MICISNYQPEDVKSLCRIWNAVVQKGNAFPQCEMLTEQTAAEFFAAQSFTAAAKDENGTVVGLYILHPNNVGRCGHICNASYAVAEDCRGRHIGEQLVRHSMRQAVVCGFSILQFNAVVAENKAARHLYEKLGFIQLGTIKNGFKTDSGFKDICPYYITLNT